jgi:D-xylose reductase
MPVPNIKLNNGFEMPQVGFGLWKVGTDTCADTVYNAIKTGYRLFDGACGTAPHSAILVCDKTY